MSWENLFPEVRTEKENFDDGLIDLQLELQKLKRQIEVLSAQNRNTAEDEELARLRLKTRTVDCMIKVRERLRETRERLSEPLEQPPSLGQPSAEIPVDTYVPVRRW